MSLKKISPGHFLTILKEKSGNKTYKKSRESNFQKASLIVQITLIFRITQSHILQV